MVHGVGSLRNPPFSATTLGATDVPRTTSAACIWSPDPGNIAGDQHHPERRRSTILVLSEVRLVREVLVEALGQALYFTGLSGVASLEEAIARMEMDRPELVLIDVSLPRSLAAARRLRQGGRTTPLVAFNMDDVAPDISEWTQAGIVAHFGRSLSLEEFVERIGTLMNKQAAEHSLTSAKPAGDDATTTDRLAGTAGAAAILTAREEEVARLIIVGETNKDIARALNISVATVKSHVHNLLGKLGLAGRGKLALGLKVLPPPAGVIHARDWAVSERPRGWTREMAGG
jgi:two-component system nitrate/nitrite response regulator NarL